MCQEKLSLSFPSPCKTQADSCLSRAATKHSYDRGLIAAGGLVRTTEHRTHAASPWSYPAPSPSSKQKEEDTEYLSQHRFNFLGSYKITKSDGLAARARHLVRWNVRQIFFPPLIDTAIEQSKWALQDAGFVFFPGEEANARANRSR